MLPKCVNQKTKEFDFKKLEATVRLATKNLNNVIDRTYYPTEKCEKSNFATRPIGIGVQGLADVFFMLEMPFNSEAALELDREIFEAIYYAFLKESMELAKIHGAYERFAGSPASQGILQFDMWKPEQVKLSGRYDWDALKEEIKTHGLRNSLGIALMPTASTASIFGNTEAFEPQKGNVYKREVSAGEFIMINKFLVEKLEELNLWNSDLKNLIINGRGSIQHIQGIPDDVKALFLHAYEMRQKVIVDHAAARAPFVDQTQSMNLFFESATMDNIGKAVMYGYEKGLKTLNYYIRQKTKAGTVQVGDAAKVNMVAVVKPKEEIKEYTVDEIAAVQAQKVIIGASGKEYTEEEALACSLDNPEACDACSS
jgi:ribonucleoside-diphosphate reductase alpha subunit